MRSLWSHVRHGPSFDSAPPLSDQHLSSLARSNAVNRGPRRSSEASDWYDIHNLDWQPAELLDPLTHSRPQGTTRVAMAQKSQRGARGGSATGNMPVRPRTSDSVSKINTPISSAGEQETLQELRQEKATLEQRTAVLEENLKRSLVLLRSLGHEVDFTADLIPGRGTGGPAAGREKDRQKSLGLSPSPEGCLIPRNILLNKLLERELEKQDTSLQSHLDKALEPEQALGFAEVLDAHLHLLSPRSGWIQNCALCRIPRFHGVPIASSVSDPALTLFMPVPPYCQDIFNEFHASSSGPTPCCSVYICDPCYTLKVCSSFKTDFWHDLSLECWIKCPLTSCNSTLPLKHPAEVTSMLSALNDPLLSKHVAQFERANALRTALRALDPRPSHDSLKRASRLARRLQKRGWMRDPFASEDTLDATIKMLPVGSLDGSGTIQVPIFAGLLGHTGSQSGRECSVCAETLVDVTDGLVNDETRWTAEANVFPEEWAVLLRPFPAASSLPACSRNHSLDICRSCLGQYLSAQLELRGRAGLESLSCPVPGCGHVYLPEELRMLMSHESFSRYDKLRLLSHLATLPEFRWCLREGCQMGQVYDFSSMDNFPTAHQRGRVFCDACNFEMCFFHQTPWHEGQTCLEYDADRGDPQMAATQEWLRQNTKPCPGLCGASVEKNRGCFHMTCQVCRYEFCWECLADWATIANFEPVTNRRRYRRDAHNPGCYFRSERAPEATMLLGNTVEDAMGVLL